MALFPKTPVGVPRALLAVLLLAVALTAGIPLRYGYGPAQWLEVGWQLLLMLLLVPGGLMLLAVPLWLRDRSFDLRKVYLMGVFAACIASLQIMHGDSMAKRMSEKRAAEALQGGQPGRVVAGQAAANQVPAE